MIHHISTHSVLECLLKLSLHEKAFIWVKAWYTLQNGACMQLLLAFHTRCHPSLNVKPILACEALNGYNLLSDSQDSASHTRNKITHYITIFTTQYQTQNTAYVFLQYSKTMRLLLIFLTYDSCFRLYTYTRTYTHPQPVIDQPPVIQSQPEEPASMRNNKAGAPIHHTSCVQYNTHIYIQKLAQTVSETHTYPPWHLSL